MSMAFRSLASSIVCANGSHPSGRYHSGEGPTARSISGTRLRSNSRTIAPRFSTIFFQRSASPMGYCACTSAFADTGIESMNAVSHSGRQKRPAGKIHGWVKREIVRKMFVFQSLMSGRWESHPRRKVGQRTLILIQIPRAPCCWNIASPSFWSKTIFGERSAYRVRASTLQASVPPRRVCLLR